MNNLLKMSEAASLALHGMVILELREGETFQTKEIAGILGCSLDHLFKVMQRLRRAGLVMSVRGPRGGIKLAHPGSEITLLEIYEAIEGPLQVPRCMLDKPICDGNCLLFGDLLQDFDKKFRSYLTETTLEAACKLLNGSIKL